MQPLLLSTLRPALLAAALALTGAPTAQAQAQAQAQTATTAKAPAKLLPPRTELPAWFIFFSSNKAPDRSIYLVDARYRPVGEGLYETQALVMRETPSGDFDHWSGTLQYQASPEQVALARDPLEKLQPLMKSVKVRTVSAYQMTGSGKVVPGQPTDWTTFKSPIDLLGFRIATDPDALKRPEAYGLVFAGNFHRPIDVVDLVRRVLPQVKDMR
ncbi:hypothetical protein [Inhella proteolytica]|uniref:Uncharacterized protein n=1 Tax=Inhella proteolytica TaxID=2795029 RepID=A0A931J1H0_9BURK|nr:hypothetical protein [Inhella proteolytica]MBH9575938.1 hypothetical protein [Inhella proteolytica]